MSGRGVSSYRTFVCGPTPDPDDPLMEYDNYFGHVPKDFNPRTGRSRTHTQVLNSETGIYGWVRRNAATGLDNTGATK